MFEHWPPHDPGSCNFCDMRRARIHARHSAIEPWMAQPHAFVKMTYHRCTCGKKRADKIHIEVTNDG